MSFETVFFLLVLAIPHIYANLSFTCCRRLIASLTELSASYSADNKMHYSIRVLFIFISVNGPVLRSTCFSAMEYVGLLPRVSF